MWKSSIDTLGHFARSLADIALMRAALMDDRPASLNLPKDFTPRIGICRTKLWPEAGAENVAMIDKVSAILRAAGAHVFIPFMALTHLPADMVTFLVNLDVGKTGILFLILGIYIVLGTFLEGLAMLVLTLPVVFEVITQLGMSPIWFGIVVVIVLEMGLISPPVGVNVFVVKSVAQEVPMGTIFRGIWPFWIAMGVCLIILVAFPEIATILPDTMFDN